jgi:DNA-binding SARP family transcriptional activator
MEFRILGPLEVVDDGRPLALGGAKPRSLLALLVLEANRVVSTDRLIDKLWGDETPATAAKSLQVLVSRLRKVLEGERDEGGPGILLTRPPGYLLRVEPGELDLYRFQQLLEEGRQALAAGDSAAAAATLRSALALWRGAPLADFAYESFAQTEIARLEELRLAALEERIEADLALGSHADLVPELEALSTSQPLRERLRGQLMLALYRSGRQAEALQAYQDIRRHLAEELGLEPGRPLQQLEQGILTRDPVLGGEGGDAPPAPSGTAAGADARSEPARARAILVVASDNAAILPLVSIAEPLARRPPRELIAVRLLADGDDPTSATTHLAGLRDELVGRELDMRVAAYTSDEPGADIVRLVAKQDVDLVLLDAPGGLLGDGMPDAELLAVLRDVLADVAVLIPRGALHRETTRPVVVPFGGEAHDWSAVEIAAWIARALGTTLQLVGTSADRFRKRRDASRLLGSASLVVQAAVGIVAEPVLVRRGSEGILEASADAALLVLGLSARWRTEGLGRSRLEVARRAAVPTLLVRRGVRPGGLAPDESMTRFTWTLAPDDLSR